MKKLIYVLTSILLLEILSVSVFYLFSYKPDMQELKRLKRNQAYLDTTELRKSGGTSTYDNKEAYKGKKYLDYDLRSWDGGKNWYAVDYNFKSGEVKILGVADSVYPKLLEHLKAWDDLSDWVEKNGAINGTEEEGIKKLEKVGFTVTKNKK